MTSQGEFGSQRVDSILNPRATQAPASLVSFVARISSPAQHVLENFCRYRVHCLTTSSTYIVATVISLAPSPTILQATLAAAEPLRREHRFDPGSPAGAAERWGLLEFFVTIVLNDVECLQNLADALADACLRTVLPNSLYCVGPQNGA